MLIVLALKEGVPPSKDYSVSNSMILQATSVYCVPKAQHVTSTVQKLIKGMPRTGLNRHGRGYATKEAGSAVHLPVSGPIGLARSHILIPYFIIIITFNRGSIILNLATVKSTRLLTKLLHYAN